MGDGARHRAFEGFWSVRGCRMTGFTHNSDTSDFFPPPAHLARVLESAKDFEMRLGRKDLLGWLCQGWNDPLRLEFAIRAVPEDAQAPGTAIPIVSTLSTRPEPSRSSFPVLPPFSRVRASVSMSFE